MLHSSIPAPAGQNTVIYAQAPQAKTISPSQSGLSQAELRQIILDTLG